MKFLKSITFFILILFLLTACGNDASLKVESKAAIKTVKATFNEKEKETNKKSGDLQFFLPAGYVIKEKTANNIILRNGSDTYILFFNPEEEASSDVVYKATVEQYKQLETKEAFTSNNKFGFITIHQVEKDELNELTVGVGGVKITTQTDANNLVKDSKIMMQIANSVKHAE